MKKLGFVEAVKIYLKGGDDRKLQRFHKRVTKAVEDQIDLREREIDDLKERIEDSHLAEKDAVLSVDFKKLKDTESIKEYADTYIDKLLQFQRDRKKLNSEIEEKENEAVYLNNLKGKLDKVEIEEN